MKQNSKWLKTGKRTELLNNFKEANTCVNWSPPRRWDEGRGKDRKIIQDTKKLTISSVGKCAKSIQWSTM